MYICLSYIFKISHFSIDNVLEMECFKVGFQFLNQQFSLNELSHEEDSDVMQWVDSTYKSMFASIDKIKEQMDDVELPDSFAKMSGNRQLNVLTLRIIVKERKYDEVHLQQHGVTGCLYMLSYDFP